MPLPITFDWTEDEDHLYFVLHARGASAKNVHVTLTDSYIRVNCNTALFEADLLHSIDPEHPLTRCAIGHHQVTLTLHKLKAGIWQDFRAVGTKADLRLRRQKSLAAAADREQQRHKRKDDWHQQMLKAGEHEQWRLDRENREQIERWEAEEKAKWETDVYQSLGIGAAEPNVEQVDLPQVPPLETSSKQQGHGVEKSDRNGHPPHSETTPRGPLQTTPLLTDAGASDGANEAVEEYVPAVRENPGKIGFRFTERPRPGVPVRDRGPRPPPHPRDKIQTGGPSALAGNEHADEADPMWLKDKADNLMAVGDYQGAYNAYTEALKLAPHARTFANRAVANLFLGQLEQCLEDGGRALRILELRQKTQDGMLPGVADPEDQVIRATVEVRCAVAYLWLGALSKAEIHFTNALDVKDGLDMEEQLQVREDLQKVRAAQSALAKKEKADASSRQASGRGQFNGGFWQVALRLYQDAVSAAPESSVLYANRCFARLCAGQLQECLADCDAALACLKNWAAAHRPPRLPARPSRLEPPYLDDPTFKHPDRQKQGEVDWLMKHSGGSRADLPPLPHEYEWVKDASEKSDNAWVAVRKKLPQSTIDAIRRATMQLQDAVYTRDAQFIRQQLALAVESSRSGEGPSQRALQQAEDFARQLELHQAAKEEERLREEAAARQEADDCDLDKLLAPDQPGVACIGFGPGHPVTRTRRRLFVKVLLRRARALELLGRALDSAGALRRVLAVEPANAEAAQRLAALTALESSQPTRVAGTTLPAEVWRETSGQRKVDRHPADDPMPGDALGMAEKRDVAGSRSGTCGKTASCRLIDEGAYKHTDISGTSDVVFGADTPDPARDASTPCLLASAAGYIKKNDFVSALQIYNYIRSTVKQWDSPVSELKVLSNTTLCLQKLRGRLTELVAACNDALDRIRELREGDPGEVPDEILLRTECACLSRRGSALAQLGRVDDSALDARKVRELLLTVGGADTERLPVPVS